MPALRRVAPPSWAPAAALVVTVVAFASGSSSVPEALEVGRTGRWVALSVLLAVALAFAAGRESLPPQPLLRAFLAFAMLPASLAVLALLSTAWSADPWLTFRRACSLAILFLTAAALAWGSFGDRDAMRRLLAAVVVGAAIVGLLGLTLFFALPDYAMQARSDWTPWRYRGFGQNPNTVALLAAVALPITNWVLLEGRKLVTRFLAAGALIMLLATILAAQSRGALLAAVIGMGTVQIVLIRSLALKALSLVLLAALLVGGSLIREISTPDQAPFVSQAPAQQVPADVGETEQPGASPGAPKAVQQGEPEFPLFGWTLPRREDEVGHPLFSTEAPMLLGSGRAEAWLQTLDQVRERPLLGYGFGTESAVFVDRLYYFQGGNPENAFLGLLLQLGAVGTLLFLAVAVTVIVASVRALRSPGADRGLVAASLGVVLAAGALMLIQSYIYSVGNIATVSVWVVTFTLAAAAATSRPEPADALEAKRPSLILGRPRAAGSE